MVTGDRADRDRAMMLVCGRGEVVVFFCGGGASGCLCRSRTQHHRSWLVQRLGRDRTRDRNGDILLFGDLLFPLAGLDSLFENG